MKQIGKVVKKDGNAAMVQIDRSMSCDHCGCGTCDDGNAFYVTVTDPIGAKAGDTVEVLIQSGKMIKTVLYVFWLPIALGVLGYWLGGLVSHAVSEHYSAWIAGISATIFVVLSIMLIVRFDKKTRTGNRGFVVTRIID